MSERSFFRTNRVLLATLFGIILFVSAADRFYWQAFYPAPHTRFNIDSTPNSNSRFWVITWETYSATLWIDQPSELDQKTFGLITGCKDFSVGPLQRVQTPTWIIRSVGDQRVVIQKEAVLFNPPANECSTTTGTRHGFSLGEFAISPGRYQFEVKLSPDIPESMTFSAELNVHCCEYFSQIHTRLGGLASGSALLSLPLLFFVLPILVLVLLIRARRFLASNSNYKP